MEPMTPEERERFDRIERLLEFLSASQAKLSTSSRRHDAEILENAKQIAENSQQIAETSRQIAQLADMTLRIGRVVEEQGRRMDERFAHLADAQLRTEERIGALINVVERYFSNGRH
jgi:hypothetical protein